MRLSCKNGKIALVDPLTNPFRPGAGTPPPALVGRDQLIDSYGIALRRTVAGRPGKSVMPIGLRGVGKTVLLNRFHEIARDEGLKVARGYAGNAACLSKVRRLKPGEFLASLERNGVEIGVPKALR